MIILGMVAYYVFAIASIGAVLFFAVRRSKRKADAAFARLEQDLQRWRETTPPLPPRPPAEPIDESPDAEDIPDLSAAALQPIAPLLMRVAKEYLDNPNERERLMLSLTNALEATTGPRA